jgi:hypothetical protein
MSNPGLNAVSSNASPGRTGSFFKVMIGASETGSQDLPSGTNVASLPANLFFLLSSSVLSMLQTMVLLTLWTVLFSR